MGSYLTTKISKELIEKELINSDLSELPDLYVFDSINSTNQWVIDKLAESPCKEVLCVTDSQASGRGRNGRDWESPSDSNIYMSFCTKVEVTRKNIAPLSLVIGLALIRVLQKKGVKGLGLKWPNDVLLLNKKLAGILIESKIVSGQLYVVVGMGVNVKMPADVSIESNLGWADLSSTGLLVEHRGQLIAEIYIECMSLINDLFQDGFALLQKEWMKNDEYAGREVSIIDQGKETVSGINEGVDENGCLLIRVNGEIKKILSGDVSLRSKNEA